MQITRAVGGRHSSALIPLCASLELDAKYTGDDMPLIDLSKINELLDLLIKKAQR